MGPGQSPGGGAGSETSAGGFGGLRPPKGKPPESAKLKSGYELYQSTKYEVSLDVLIITIEMATLYWLY